MSPGRRYRALLGVAVLATTACADEPSFRVRWRVEPAVELADDGAPLPSDDPGPLTSPDICTEVGINQVRIETWALVGDGVTCDPVREDTTTMCLGQDCDDDCDMDGTCPALDECDPLEQCLPEGVCATRISERTRPCFPRSFEDPDRTLAGPALPGGSYLIKLRGIRRDGVPWVEVDPEDGHETEYATAAVWPVEIPGDERPLVLRTQDDEELLIPAPPQCDDGVDNDADGVVDDADPSCQLVGGVYEGGQAVVRQFRAAVTFLDHNPNVVTVDHCSGMGVYQIRFQAPGTGVCDEELVAPHEDDCLAVTSCADALSKALFFSPAPSQDLQAIEVVATGADGSAITVAKQFPILSQGLTQIDVDFADSDFLTPIQAPITYGFRLFPGSANNSVCQRASGTSVQIADFVLEVVDAHGAPLPSPVALEDGGPALDGVTPYACAPSVQRTEDLIWGGYLIRGVARSAAGEACFEVESSDNSPFHAAVPGTTAGADPDDPLRGSNLTFRRLTDPLPPSCVECSDDADCNGLLCRDQICVECETAADCAADHVCTNTACEPA